MLDEAYSLFPGGQDGPRFGGAGIQLYSIADELSQHPGFEVAWLFFDTERYDISRLSHPRIKILTHRDPIQKGLPLLSRVLNKRRQREPYQDFLPDVVISTTGLWAARLAREAEETGAKAIFRIASDSDITNPLCPNETVAQQIKDTIAAFDQVVVSSNDQKIELEKLRKKGILHIPKYPLVGKEKQASPEADSVLWVASCQDLKQPWLYLVLAALFPDERFVMVMPPMNKELSEYISMLASELNNIELLNEQVTHDGVLALFSEAKLFVNTSVIEGCPNTFHESCAAGVPILSLWVNPDDMIHRYGLGACADGSLRKFMDDCAKLLSDRSELAIKGRNARKFFEQNFDRSEVMSQWVSVIRQVAGDVDVSPDQE